MDKRITRCSAVGSALGSGPRGREFKSRHLDHQNSGTYPLFLFSVNFPGLTSSRSLCQARYIFIQGSRKDLKNICGIRRNKAQKAKRHSCRGGAALLFRRGSGPRGREFKSRHLDHQNSGLLSAVFVFRKFFGTHVLAVPLPSALYLIKGSRKDLKKICGIRRNKAQKAKRHSCRGETALLFRRGSGPRGREFKSRHLDHVETLICLERK